MSKQPPGFPGQNNKYVNDFTKALASEVRILLAEVGKLRDERRQLQYEIAELMAMKSKHGAGGEFTPDWRPKIEAPPPGEPAPPPPAIEAEPVQAKPGGWHVVHKRPERKAIKGKQPVPPPAPTPAPIPVPVRAELPAWAQWRPNPHLAPAPISAPASPAPPPGLFGPPTPPPK
ncbi:hypothetical protein AN958_08344 [Leucoagaricus sp. SymC.cos]|nr:hypothetical protein AN958_08344 [Leucoagaricus sp. SymC.cos]